MASVNATCPTRAGLRRRRWLRLRLDFDALSACSHYVLLPAHHLPQQPPLHHLAHLSHAQPHPGMLSIAPLQGLPHPQHPQIHPGMTLNDSMNQHLDLVLQMDQHPQFDNNSFASTQQVTVSGEFFMHLLLLMHVNHE
ncbi:hypothetical protein ACJJTC_011222 [Scirpophaga incertulas]